MIKFPCPTCSRTISAPDESAGRKGKCPSCQAIMVVPTRAALESMTQGVPAKKKAPPKEEEPYVAEVVEDDEIDERIETRRPRGRRRDEEDDYDRPRGR